MTNDLDVELAAQVRAILKAHGRLQRDALAITERDDLYAAGMTSHASVNVMLGLEEAFDIEFPDEMLNRQVFASIETMVRAVQKLRG